MTQYTIGKDGKVKSKGTGKKPIDLSKAFSITGLYTGPLTKKIKKLIAGNGKAKAAYAAQTGKGKKPSGPTKKKKLSEVSGKTKAKAKRAAIREKARKSK
jgi:hypothetical protein